MAHKCRSAGITVEHFESGFCICPGANFFSHLSCDPFRVQELVTCYWSTDRCDIVLGQMERTSMDGVTSSATIFTCAHFTLNSECQNVHKQNSPVRVCMHTQFSMQTLLLVSAQAGLNSPLILLKTDHGFCLCSCSQ